MKQVNVYAVIREMREQIVKTMQERGIKEFALHMSYQEWGKTQGYKPDDFEEDESDDTDYLDYLDQEAPYVIFFNKWNNGIDYRVDKVKLIEVGAGVPVLEFECHANEEGYGKFGEDDVVFLTLYNVYTTMYVLLEIKDEPEYVWVFTAEQAWDGEFADVVVKTFPTEAAAVKYLHDFLLDDGGDESIRDYVKRKEWEVEMDEPELYRAYDEGRYSTDHIELTITKCQINETKTIMANEKLERIAQDEDLQEDFFITFSDAFAEDDEPARKKI